jgi:hypothetical protein
VFKPLLVEGETGTWTPPFSNLKRAFIKSIKSTGRNLFDKSKAKDGYEIVTGATGEEGVAAEWFVTDLIPVIPNTRYTITGKANGDVTTQYDVNKKPLGSSGGGTYGFTTYSNAAFVKLNGKLTQKDTFQLEIGATASEYTPYTEEIYQLPETLELGEWDSFNPQTGELIKQTGCATSDTGFTEEEIAGYDGAIVSSDKRSLEYKLETPTIEKIENAPKQYKAWNNGSETIIQGETDNSKYGAMPTITNEYILKIGGEE